MAIGVAGTTDYQSRGITQSDSDPAIQGYIEPSYGLGPVLGDAFVNIWSSSDVDFGAGVQGAEIDVAAGIKPKFLGPKWSPNIGWVHYFYAPEDLNPAYGEVYAKTDYTFGEEDRSDGQIGTSSPLQIFNSEFVLARLCRRHRGRSETQRTRFRSGQSMNVGIASMIYAKDPIWWLAGSAGAVVGAVWNYGVSGFFTWKRNRIDG